MQEYEGDFINNMKWGEGQLIVKGQYKYEVK